MSILDLVKSIFGDPGKTSPSTSPFQELDIEKMKQNLKLEEEGTRRGVNNYPDTDNQSFDDIEEQIITTIEGVKRFVYEERADQLRTYGDRIASLGFQTRFSQFMSIGNEAKSEFIAKGHVGADLLYQLRRDVIIITGQQIVQNHRLTIQPVIPVINLAPDFSSPLVRFP